MKTSNYHSYILLFSIGLMLLLSACGKEYYLEKRMGPWEITKVEIANYSNFSSTPISSTIYSSDTLGSFLFYHGSPKRVSIYIHYPSAFLVQDYTNFYEVQEENSEILVIINNSVEKHFTVKNPNSSKQELTIVKENIDGSAIRETITLEKQ